MNNHNILNQLSNMQIGQISALSIEELNNLRNQVLELVAKALQVKDWLDGAIQLKYEKQASSERAKLGKYTGKINLTDGQYIVSIDVPARSNWDQKELESIFNRIEKTDDDPKEYIDISYKISERKYKSWPQVIRSEFDKARTLKKGKPVITINHKEK